MDWSAIQIVATMMPANAFGTHTKLEEAIEFLNGRDFAPNDSQPAQVEFDDSLHFRFPTPRPCEFAENNLVHGRLYRCIERWQQRPVIILLPGWNDSGSYKLRFPLIARHFNRAGFNVATFVPPYHFQRRPRQRATFDNRDCLRLAEATAQAIAEIRALTGWLLKDGSPAVALWGFSMGAWHAGIAACRDQRLASIVMCAPCVRANPWVEQRALRPRIRATLPWRRELCDRLNRTVLNMTMIQPVIPRANILLIEAIFDFMCPKEDLEDLGKNWELPEIWRLPHGHVGVCCGFVPGLPGRVLRWLAPRLDKPVAQCHGVHAAHASPDSGKTAAN
jgi:pimeloyl-ACP methyl ester carboxylesterase